MKNHQFEAFYQVMLTGSVTEAARKIGRTQPAVSMTIKALEEQLGFALFERTSTGLKPRVEAQVMFERLQPVIEQLHDIERSMVELAPGYMPRISMIAANNVGTFLMPSRIAPLASEGQAIGIMNGSASRILTAMEAQQFDIAIMDEGEGLIPQESPLYDSERFDVPLYALFPKGMIESKGDVVSMTALKKHKICLIYNDHKLGREMTKVFGRPLIEFQNFYPMACYALRSQCVAIVDYITCTTVKSLNSGNPVADWRRLESGHTSAYYLLRPRFRPRSEKTDQCHAILRDAMLEHT